MPSFTGTLRFKLAAAFFMWTGLMLIALALLLPRARERFLIEAVDTRLQQVGIGLVGVAQQQNLSPQQVASVFSLAPSLDPSGILVVVRDKDGVAVASTKGAEIFEPPFDPANDHPNVFINAERDGVSQRVRVVTVPVRPASGQPYFLQVMSSLKASDQINVSLQFVTAIGLIIGLIGSAIGGWFISGAVISRVRGVAKAVREVSPTRLDERIDLPVSNDEIGQMAADVNHMLERMAVAFRSQERFMSEVSHELKTPVSALLSEAQVLKLTRNTPRTPRPVALANGVAAPDPRREIEPYEKFVLSVEEEMRWLGKLVESFLMLARFGHGKQFVAETLVPINDVVLDAVEHSTLYARQHGVKLALSLYDPGESNPEALVRGDSELLRVVADNLIRNAVQFSKRGDTVSVKLISEVRDNSQRWLILTVKDQGPGVPPEYLNRIFDRFAQAPGKSSTRRGSGLGLTIAKSITDLHGGSIDARNDPSGGCIFRVQLPMSTQAAPQPSGPQAPGPVSTPATHSSAAAH